MTSDTGGGGAKPPLSFEEIRAAALALHPRERRRLINDLRASLPKTRGRPPTLEIVSDLLDDQILQLALAALKSDSGAIQQTVIDAALAGAVTANISPDGIRERVRAVWPQAVAAMDLEQRARAASEEIALAEAAGVKPSMHEPISEFLARWRADHRNPKRIR